LLRRCAPRNDKGKCLERGGGLKPAAFIFHKERCHCEESRFKRDKLRDEANPTDNTNQFNPSNVEKVFPGIRMASRLHVKNIGK